MGLLKPVDAGVEWLPKSVRTLELTSQEATRRLAQSVLWLGQLRTRGMEQALVDLQWSPDGSSVTIRCLSEAEAVREFRQKTGMAPEVYLLRSRRGLLPKKLQDPEWLNDAEVIMTEVDQIRDEGG